ncbi:MAG: hypothetical protein K8I02_00740, partial [Candidatus Methylomirabilis sp.]|nr:hypothetical protein [Deltaproteobacteria bacterium]
MTDNEGKPVSAMRVVRPGWVEVGGARMSLLEIKGGFQSFKEVIHQAVGAEASDLVYEFGLRGAIEFMTHALGRGAVSPDASGFRAALRIYTDAGFGHYQARDLDYGRGFAVVEAEDA